MQVQMYAVREMSKDSRHLFKLEADPYEDILGESETTKYLKSLGVVFFRDQNHSQGILYEHADSPVDYLKEFGWLGYLSSCDIDENTGMITTWRKPEDAVHARERQEYVAKRGDDFSWYIFNRPVTVSNIDSSGVTVV